ncbi:hypothetical protein ACJJTC_015641 [Scirpophaga incertulas]
MLAQGGRSYQEGKDVCRVHDIFKIIPKPSNGLNVHDRATRRTSAAAAGSGQHGGRRGRALTSCMNPWCTSSAVTPHVSSSCRLWPARRQAGPRAHLVYEPVVHQLGSHAARQQQLPALASTEAGGAARSPRV